MSVKVRGINIKSVITLIMLSILSGVSFDLHKF